MSDLQEQNRTKDERREFTEESLRGVVSRLGDDLRGSLGAVATAASGELSRAAELSKSLRVNQALAGKVLMAVRKHDPLLATHLLPGPEALRTFLRGARAASISADVVDAAEHAVTAFEGFLKRDVGGRAELDAIISAWLPEARQRFELASKQSSYRSALNIKGVAADLMVNTLITSPSKTCPGYYDGCEVLGAVGLRRFRPGVPAKLSSEICGTPSEKTQSPKWESLDGQPLREATESGLLREFCSPQDAKVVVRSGGKGITYLLDQDLLGVGSAVDIFMGFAVRSAVPPQPSDGPPRRRGIGGEIEIPCKSYILDSLTHKDVWPGSSPELAIYDTAVCGMCDINDPDSDLNRLHLEETIQYIGEGIEKFRNPEVPRYLEMLKYTFDKLGLNPEDFRAHRVRVKYPIYGSQFVLAYDT